MKKKSVAIKGEIEEGINSGEAVDIDPAAHLKSPKVSKRNTQYPANAWEAIVQLGKQAEDAGIQDMSLDEINAIIKEVRDSNN